MTNKSRTLYIGATNDLIRRIYEHKNHLIEGFTKRYRITKLVYFEETSDIQAVQVAPAGHGRRLNFGSAG